MKWTTKDNKEININDMKTSHITNCISLLRKRIKEGRTIKRSGGGSSYDIDSMWYEETDITEQLESEIHEFEHELIRRKLEL